ncbi:hypothetical protein BRC86_09055 [Halobacteriales archaeon QS_3_64_16]|nr:MAG: hypothetical protein BRC86_09055 [Halobacteriales archaeon QS_3_64_16]
MSTYTTPIDAMFETQRSAIKQGQQATKQTLEFQRNASRMALSGLKSSESAQRQGVELLESGAHSYLSAVEAMTPGAQAGTGQLRRQTDELFGQLKTSHADVFATLTEEAERGVRSYDELTAEYLDAMDEQLETLLDAHTDIQSQVLKATEGYEDRSEEFQERFEEAMDDQVDRAEQFQQQLEEQFETQVARTEQFQQQLEEQVEQFQAQLDEQAAQLQENVRA